MKETPIFATLDTDLQFQGTHCTHCLRPVQKGMAIGLESDLLKAVYCSKKCQVQSRTQYHNALFGVDSVISVDIDAELKTSIKDKERANAQEEFIKHWTSSQSSSCILVARLVVLQVIAELAKQLGTAEALRKDLPDIAIDLERSLYDHFERLRYLDTSFPGEYEALKKLLIQTFPDYAESYTDERHALFKGKMSYNVIGVCFGGGRDDKPQASSVAEAQHTRTPYGTSKQVGCGLYFVSSYVRLWIDTFDWRCD